MEVSMPNLIEAENISKAWLEALNYLLNECKKEYCTNLMVHIKNPLELDEQIDRLYLRFCKENDLTNQYKVATFIFPQKLYHLYGDARDKIYAKQKKIHKVVKGPWGSYFDQMVAWKGSKNDEPFNQVEKIIQLINSRERTYKAAYTIQITNPKFHSNYVIGGPCLRYITLQLNQKNKEMSFLALYRNHDFARRAYGNYIGLGNLLNFMANQTGFRVDTLTCVSSNAYIENKYKKRLRKLLVEATNE
jgi:thymidylate synthase